MAEDETIELRQIEPGDSVSGLSLGDAALTPLKMFLKKHAREYHANDLAKTYALFASTAPKKVIAYITLVCGQVETKEQVGEQIGGEVVYTYDHCPAVKIARLAVDRRYERKGLGKHLVDFALGLTKDEISPRIGCRFVIVDSKKSAVDFYRKCGFTLLNTAANKELDTPVMFVDLRKVLPG